MAKKINILIVDDSAFMRLLINDLVTNDESMNVVGTASNGLEAVDQVQKLRPDIVLLDMNMEAYDGMYAVREIMKKRPTPILILSSVGNVNLEPIFEALSLGAVDYINKPVQNNFKMRELHGELIEKIKNVSKAHPRINQKPKPMSAPKSKNRNYDIVVIGASTGGPSAIEQVISSFAEDFPVPVVICQHMPAAFIAPFVHRLDGLSQLEVRVATEGTFPTPGTILVCPGDANPIIEKSKGKPVISFTDTKARDYNNPSISLLFTSVAETYGDRTLGILLTGMGKDGVVGLKSIKENGGHTIVQDETSSIIYGMPKVAMEVGAATEQLHIKEIGNRILNII